MSIFSISKTVLRLTGIIIHDGKKSGLDVVADFLKPWVEGWLFRLSKFSYPEHCNRVGIRIIKIIYKEVQK